MAETSLHFYDDEPEVQIAEALEPIEEQPRPGSIGGVAILGYLAQ